MTAATPARGERREVAPRSASKAASSKPTRSILFTASTTWRMPSSEHDAGVPAGLRQHALAGVDQDQASVGGGGAGRHVAGVLLVSRRVGDDEARARGVREKAIGDIDGDALLALRLQAVDQQREIELVAGGAVAGANRGSGPRADHPRRPRIEEQPADQRRLAVVDAAAGEEPQQSSPSDGSSASAIRSIPLASCVSIDAGWPSSISRPWRSDEARRRQLGDDRCQRRRRWDSMAPVSG